MNGKKAKALRRALLNGETRYVEGKKGKRQGKDGAIVEITGTIVAVGVRRRYQNVKRNKKLAAVLLGAK